MFSYMTLHITRTWCSHDISQPDGFVAQGHWIHRRSTIQMNINYCTYSRPLLYVPNIVITLSVSLPWHSYVALPLTQLFSRQWQLSQESYIILYSHLLRGRYMPSIYGSEMPPVLTKGNDFTIWVPNTEVTLALWICSTSSEIIARIQPCQTAAVTHSHNSTGHRMALKKNPCCHILWPGFTRLVGQGTLGTINS